MTWQPVLKVIPDGRASMVTVGFDWDETYQFRRGFDGKPWTGRGSDFHPLHNIAGLWFRPTPPQSPLANIA